MNPLRHIRRAGTAIVVLAFLHAGPADSATRYGVDKNHTTVGFSVPIMGLGKVTGKFTDFTISLLYDEKDITRSSVQVTIKAESINTGILDRDKHLRSADFFEVEKYPEITFQSTRIEKKRGKYTATGPFTMRGVTREITLAFTVHSSVEKAADAPPTLGIAAATTLNRHDFGINWEHSSVPAFVGDDVSVEVFLLTRGGKRE